MRKLLEDIFGDPKEKQDFIIALVVVALFGVAILWQILPNRSDYADEILNPTELALKSEQLEVQKVPTNNTIVSDLNRGYSPYYDHKEKELVMAKALEKTALEETKLATDALIAANLAKAKESQDAGNQEDTEAYSEVIETPTTEVLTEEALVEDDLLSEEEIAEDIENTEILSDEATKILEEEERVEEPLEIIEDEPTEEVLEAEEEAAAIAKLEAEKEAAKRLAIEQKAEEERKATAKKRRQVTQESTSNTLNGCHVIVGVFKNRTNARGFRDKVSAADFDAKIGKVKGRTYVAIPVNCNNNWEMKNMQKRVNEAFDLNSWILKN